jgi:type IV secretory pathway VirB9-like protein
MGTEAMTLRKQSLTHFLLLILVVSTILVIVSGKEWTESIASTVQPPMPGPDAQQLWKYIAKDNYERDHEANIQSQFVHDNLFSSSI